MTKAFSLSVFIHPSIHPSTFNSDKETPLFHRKIQENKIIYILEQHNTNVLT